MNRAERRRQQYAKRTEVHEAMRAAIACDRFDVSAEIASWHNVDTCPVCVERPTNYGQRVYFEDAPAVGLRTTAWICVHCADAHCAVRNDREPVPFNIETQSPNWQTIRLMNRSVLCRQVY